MFLRSAVTLIVVGVATLVTGVHPTFAYETVIVTDGGTIQGKISFSGSPPPAKKVVPNKNPEVCGGEREVPQMLLAPDRGIQDGFVYLKKVEKGKGWDKAAKAQAIDNQKCEFRPHVMVVPIGDIEIVNSDPVLHNTHGFYGKATAFNVALPNQGQRIKKPLKRSGLVRVECDAHTWMLAWLYVADSPYYAVTAKDGTFTIADVPPGSYTLVAWQAHTGEVERPIVVKPKEAVSVAIDLAKK